MGKSGGITVFSLGGKDIIHTDMCLEDARYLWQKHLSANELMPMVDMRMPGWPMFVNPHQVKCITRVLEA